VLAAAGRRRQLWPLAAALVLGPVVATGAWALARAAVPIFPDTGWPVPPPAVADPAALLVPWLVAAGALLAGAALTLGGTRSETRMDRRGTPL
jgi:hypothetical protein